MKKLEQQSQAQLNKDNKHQRQQLQKDEYRSKEIDSIIQKLYEDNLLGKISDERFVKLSQSYEEEQKQLQTSISDLTTTTISVLVTVSRLMVAKIHITFKNLP